jgi:hypothetical protein
MWMKRVGIFSAWLLLAGAIGVARADEFTAIQHSPYTYWVPAPGYGDYADDALPPPPPGYYGYYDNGAPVPPPPPPPPPGVVIVPRFFFGFHFH